MLQEKAEVMRLCARRLLSGWRGLVREHGYISVHHSLHIHPGFVVFSLLLVLSDPAIAHSGTVLLQLNISPHARLCKAMQGYERLLLYTSGDPKLVRSLGSNLG